MTRSARVSLSLVFVSSLAVAACGGGSLKPPPTHLPDGGVVEGEVAADFQDGSRLTFPLWRTADGFAVRKGTIYDGALDVDCTFEIASDGRRRCLPASRSVVNERFADPACTEPLADFGSVDARYVRSTWYSTACAGRDDGVRVEIREAGAEVETTTVYEISATAGGCVEAFRNGRQSYRYTGAVVPPDRFVAAEEALVQPTGRARLAQVRLAGEDGAWLQQATFHDTRYDVRCTPQLASDGRFRCLPAGRHVIGIEVDRGRPDCSGPQIASPVRCADGAADVIEVPSTSCPRYLALHAPGAAWAGREKFGMDQNGICVAGFGTSASGVEVGAELAPAQYALLELRHMGTGRLRTSLYVDVDIQPGHGARASGTSAFDTALGAPCAFTTDDAGATRCQPALLTPAFRDAGCSEAVAIDMYASLVDPCFASDTTPRFTSIAGALYGPATRAAQPYDQLFRLIGPNAICENASSLLEPYVTHYATGPRTADMVAATP